VIGSATDGQVSDGDMVIFFNFRPDRTRELTRAFIEAGFAGFDRRGLPPQVQFIGMTEYEASFNIPIAFPDTPPEDVLAEVISRAGLTQLHIAETEKYAHVTFFFNGGRDEPFPGETRRLVPSPRDVETYDQKPAMSAHEVVAAFRTSVEREPADFTILNFANPDMVGHTGVLSATVEALEHVDFCLAEVLEVLRTRDAQVFVTADHGNAEFMLSPDGSPSTAHTTNPVYLVYVGGRGPLREGAGLSDLAPTVLHLLGVDKPGAMTGRTLVD
jgi:2,3-bisphosphoglycerate-independent phosphoglycerate mutase